MQVKAKSRYVRVSPYKLRPLVDVVRGGTVEKAIAFLKTNANKRVRPILKLIESAYANAKNVDSSVTSAQEMNIKEIKVDQGPTVKYFKPAAMGRSSVQRKRLSHMEIILEKK